MTQAQTTTKLVPKFALAAVLNTNQSSHVLLDESGEILYFNRPAERLAKRHYHTRPVIGDHFRTFLLSGTEGTFTQFLQRAHKGESIIAAPDMVFKLGKRIFQNDFYPVHCAEEQLSGVLLVTTDITAQKEAAEQIRLSEQRLNAIFDSSLDACLFLDKEFVVQLANREAKQRLGGAGQQSLEGKLIFDLMPPDVVEEYKRMYQMVLAGKPLRMERCYEDFWALISLSAVANKRGEVVGISHVAKDITVRKLDEKQMNQQNVALRKIAWQQSHEVRRPLANILGLIPLLKTLPCSSADEHEIISLLERSATDLDQVIKSIVAQADKPAARVVEVRTTSGPVLF